MTKEEKGRKEEEEWRERREMYEERMEKEGGVREGDKEWDGGIGERERREKERSEEGKTEGKE